MAVQIIDSLRHRRPIVLLSTALAGAALAVAGCGGDSQSGASPSETASYVPAGSPFYLEATTDFDGPQWTQVDALAKLFPAYPELRTELDDALRSEKVDFETEVRPLLGERAAIGGLALPDAVAAGAAGDGAAGAADAASAAADDTEFVAVVELADGGSDGMKALLTKSGATRAGEHDGAEYYTADGDTVAAVTDDALVVSDTKEQVFAALDAHQAGGDKTLAGTARFSDAIGKLPADVFGQAYFDVGGAVSQAGATSPQLSQLGLSGYQDAVLAASIAAEPDGVRVKGVLAGAPDPGAGEFSPTLTEKAPADAIAYVGFDDISTTLTNALAQAQASQGTEAREQFDALGGQLPQLLGVSLDDLAALGSGEQSVVVTSGAKEIGVAISSQVADGAQATKTLDALRAGLPALLGTFSPGAQAPKAVQVPLAAGVTGWRVPIDGDTGVVYGVDGDLVIVGNSVPAVVSVQRPTTPLSSSAAFQAGTSGMPGDVTGVMWLNVEEALTAARKAGALEGADAKDLAQVRPIKSVSGWTTGGDTPTFEVFVRIAG
jgi:Protein of unknown function (DUF3352)